jgi:hypothetical protein
MTSATMPTLRSMSVAPVQRAEYCLNRRPRVAAMRRSPYAVASVSMSSASAIKPRVIGSIGLEHFGRNALLRSLAVAQPARNDGLGGRPLVHAEDLVALTRLFRSSARTQHWHPGVSRWTTRAKARDQKCARFKANDPLRTANRRRWFATFSLSDCCACALSLQSPRYWLSGRATPGFVD